MRNRLEEIENNVKTYEDIVTDEDIEWLISTIEMLLAFIGTVSPAWLPYGIRSERHKILKKFWRKNETTNMV